MYFRNEMNGRDGILSVCIGGFVAGILFRSFFDFGFSFTFFVAVIAGALCILGRVSEPPRPPRTGRLLFLSLFLFAASLGMARYDLADLQRGDAILSEHVGEKVSLEGVVSDEPDERENSIRLIVDAESVTVGEETFPVGARVLVNAPLYPRFEYGDRVELFGSLAEPENFSDEVTLREVDYRSYLAKDGIYYEMFRPKVSFIASGEGNWLVEKLFLFKNAFLDNVSRFIPEPHVSLLGGLIVGAKHSLGKKLLDDFRTVGVIHIVVLSGYNITIIARFIEWIFSGLKRNLRLTVAAGAMTLFAIMVGASATVVRATAMALIALLAKATGRMYIVTRALLIAGFFMLLHNPKILVFDTSFQLSFLATVGLIYFSPLILPKVKWVTERWNMREIVVATVATQLFVLPFLLYKTGLFSVVSLPVNVLILAAIPATMLLGFLAGLAGFVWTTLALPFAYGAYALLAYELAVVEWFARLPFASVTFASFPLALVFFWYGTYALLFLWLKKGGGAGETRSKDNPSHSPVPPL